MRFNLGSGWSQNKRRKIVEDSGGSDIVRRVFEMIEAIGGRGYCTVSGKASRRQEPRKTITVDMVGGERSSTTAQLYVNYIDIVSSVHSVPLYSLLPFSVFRVISSSFFSPFPLPIGPSTGKSRHLETVFPCRLIRMGN